MKLFTTTPCRVLMVAWWCALLCSACRGNDIYIEPESQHLGDSSQASSVVGFYLLNEGNMGSNKATLDYYDYASATYTRNIYSAANPTMAQSLGDVGNDLHIYGHRLYVVINCSNLVEVMDVATAKHLGTINCPNCRNLCFQGQYGYLSSYAGPVLVDEGYKQRGYVLKFDTATLQTIDTCHVGFQPDELEIVGDYLYVANSGGYMTPNYENTLTVIDLNTFTRVGCISVAPNLQCVRKDTHHQLWVSSRGDYYGRTSKLYCVDTDTQQVVDSLPIAVSGMWMDGDSLYVYGSEWSYTAMQDKVNYAIVNVLTHQVVTDCFIHDDSVQIASPYGIMVHPQTKDIYLTDARNKVSPGVLWCLDHTGKQKWHVRTGDIPAHMALVMK